MRLVELMTNLPKFCVVWAETAQTAGVNVNETLRLRPRIGVNTV